MTGAKQIDTVTLARVLKRAETEFSERGFEGAGIEVIALDTGICIEVLLSHFGSKDELYADVVRNRANQINAERMTLLEGIDLSELNALDKVLDAFYRPAMGPIGRTGDYRGIFAWLVIGGERNNKLVEECYDPIAHRFIAAIESTSPLFDRRTATLSYGFALGAFATLIDQSGRLERLIGESTALEPEQMLRSLVAFSRAGIEGLIADHHWTA